MNMHLVAFVVGLVALADADVSHLKQPSANSFTNDDQNHVSLKLNAGNNQNTNNRYWWLNSETSPFSRPGASHQTQHNLHETRQQNYNQNQFLNANTQPESQHNNNIYADMATLSGSPFEVNGLTQDNTQTNIVETYRPFVPKIPCFGASQVCAPKNACENGFISERNLGLVLSQSNNCDSQLEACCNIQPDAISQDDQLSSCSDVNSACVSSKYCFNGFIDQSVEHKAVRSSKCVAPAVCCRLTDRKRAAPAFHDSDFAAAGSTSEVLTKEGYVVNVPTNQYLPSFPEPEFNPDSSKIDVSRIKPETPRPVAQPKCSNGAPDSAYPDCCTNGGRGQYCCTNGANNPECSFPTQRPIAQPKCSNGAPDSAYPDCCTNGGRGQYCCTNGANNPECSFPTQRPIAQPKCSNGAPDSAYPDCCTNGGRGQYCCTNGANNPECSFPTQRPIAQPTQPTYQPAPSTFQPTYAPVPQTQRPTPPPVRINPTPKPYQPQANNPQPSYASQDKSAVIPAACAAAMNCTLIDYCDAIGVISKTPVQLTEFQKEYRVPMTDCMILPSKELGKCCRDPEYTDPWPIGRLGQYNADELNAVFDSGAYKPEGQKAAASRQVPVRVSAPLNQQRVAARPYREITSHNAQPIQPVQPAQQNQESCGVRNLNTQPRGRAPLGTGFGEFTWVAMVILESKKALLCGGSIIAKNVVVTSANCVQGHRDNDVLIKAGEWRLGSDEEPKPFQIVRVQRIVVHPQHQPQSLEHDIALLYLENDIKYDTHVGPICLDQSEPSPSDECITTGWGKEVLKVHLGNALMQHTRVSVLPQADCQSQLGASRLGYKDSLVCGVTQQDACEVDVGSALACADHSGRYSLKGIYSTETGCNQPNQIVAYTRTDLAWINDFLRNSARQY